MHRRSVLMGASATLIAGCSNSWKVDYDATLDPTITKSWKLKNVIAVAPQELTVSNADTFAPNADIVWHGEPYGDRRAQVARIVDEGITLGANELKGDREVSIAASLSQFHAVTPLSVARAPSAVHNIAYRIQIFDEATGAPLTKPQVISADLEAYVGSAAIAAAVEGNSQRVRIVRHIANVTRGWLGFGPDQRRTFSRIGR